MDTPKIFDKKPAAVQVEEGKTYAWCSCGLSANQPFCDGSHKTTDMKPHIFTAEKTDTVYLCNCKQTAGKPFCDGKHKSL